MLTQITTKKFKKKPTENCEAKVIADNFTRKISEDNLLAYTEGSKTRQAKSVAGVIIPPLDYKEGI